MSNHTTRIGIIDIGSNSIRLVIYEINAQGAYRIVSEHKDSARLSERMDQGGVLHNNELISIVPILRHYAMLCQTQAVTTVRAVATAAVRNAANTADIVRVLEAQTGLRIEVLSGYEEARFGYLGVINSMSLRDGMIIDIGGGSTEVSFIQNRKLVQSVSFPFGAVNTTRQYMKGSNLSEQEIADIRKMIGDALASQPWITKSPGLPMVGLGGTIRALGKMSRKRNKYPLQLAHNYVMKPGELQEFTQLLSTMPIEKRKKVDGLAKERADIMVPGLLILEAIYEAAQASSCVISGSGLRDGLFYETYNPKQPTKPDVLEASIQNVLMLHPNGAEKHVRHVNGFAMQLYDAFVPSSDLDERGRMMLHTAAMLYRIGVSVHYYQYLKHTEYMIQEAHIDGLSHREIIITSLIATFKTKNRTQQQSLVYKDLLLESDTALIMKLGTLLRLATAMDFSETQPIQSLDIHRGDKNVTLNLLSVHSSHLELREINALSKDFEKAWGLKLAAQTGVFSMK